MTLSSRRVTPGRKAHGKVPGELAAGALRLAQLEVAGLAAQVDGEFRLARRGGFGGLDLFAFAILYLSAGRQSSIRAFATRHAAHLPSIASIVGRRDLPSAASVSRTLSSLSASQVEPFTDTLLSAVPRRLEMLSEPAVTHRDAHGESWHVFDFDPTTRAFRQRDLPTAPDLPEPERKVEAVPGYVGRKRGEVRQQDHLLQHAGSGLWVFYRLNATGGSAMPYFAGAAAAARRCVEEIAHPAVRTVIRADGEFGHAAAVRACLEQGVHHLVRLSRYHLFDRPEVQAALSDVTWRPVADSIVEREAADLGTLMLFEGDAADADGVATRVVLTRFRSRADEPHRGVVRDGYQIEMFGTSLPADAWAAEDVAALYASRSMIENSFACEDREYDLERTFSYTAAGQAFFVAVGLFLWNDAICRPTAALPLPTRLPAQELRTPPDAPPEPTVEDRPLLSPDAGVEHGHMVVESAQEGLAGSSRERGAAESLRQLMIEAAAGRHLLEGWRFDAAYGVLRCPAGEPLHAVHADVSRRDAQGTLVTRNRISLRSALRICDGCPLRPDCFTGSTRYKRVTWRVSDDLARRIKPVLAALAGVGRAAAPPGKSARSDKVGQALFRPPSSITAGPLIPRAPAFSPAAARRHVRDALREVEVEIVVPPLPRRGQRHPLMRVDERPSARLSWTQRRRRAQTNGCARVIATARIQTRRILAIPLA